MLASTLHLVIYQLEGIAEVDHGKMAFSQQHTLTHEFMKSVSACD